MSKTTNTNWYFTFAKGTVNSEGYVEVKACTERDARAIMKQQYGLAWMYCYTENEWTLKSGQSIADLYGYVALNSNRNEHCLGIAV